MTFSPPPSMQDSPISKLTEAELSEVFKRLPPHERLLVSEVCLLWHEISRKAWPDVTALDLSPIPGAHIRAIIKQCPNLQSVFALRKSFGLDELSSLHQSAHLSSVKLYDCEFAVNAQALAAFQEGFGSIFSENVQHAAWNEFLLHDERTAEEKRSSTKTTSVYGGAFPWWEFDVGRLPASLTRLQLSCSRRSFLPYGLRKLQNLQCLILHSLWIDADISSSLSVHVQIQLRDVATLRNLKELFVGPATAVYFALCLEQLVSSLPQLEVLFAVATGGTPIDQFPNLISKRSALRILVLSGELDALADPVEVPARKRYPNGFGSEPLPLLHVFVSSAVLQKLHFAPSDAALVYPINAPMPEFLERGDIEPIFKGVWIAEKIKETAKYRAKL